LSAPIYAHTLNAVPFLEGLADRDVEVHWGVASQWPMDAVALRARVWDTGPVPAYRNQRGRVRDVSARYDWLLRDAADRMDAVREVIATVSPDIVLTDSLGYAGALASESVGIPWVSFGDGPLHYPEPTTPPFGAGLPYGTSPSMVRRNAVVQVASRRLVMAAAQERYDALRERLGLAPTGTPVLEAVLSPLLHLHCGVPELEYPRADLPEQVHFVGALRPPSRRPWTPPQWWSDMVQTHSGRVVLVSQGTLRANPRELLAPALEALRDTRRAAVLTTGVIDPALLGGPGQVSGAAEPLVAVESFVPYDSVLPHVGAFVTNGGWTGVLLALAHGVPVLQVGRTEEKADIGRRVEWAGAGLHLGVGYPQPHRLSRELERLEQPEHRTGAQRLAASLAARDPGRDGAELILRVAARVD
jgi:UDP:flavonoid glycosyltransferase YjiC (YdhE family)